MCMGQEMMSEIGLYYDRLITIYMDSQSEVCFANNPMNHKLSTYIDIKYHWIKEKVGDEHGIVHLLQVSSGEIVANIFTKALATDAFKGC